MPLPTREEMLKRVRQKQDERSKSRRDPEEFSCPKVKDEKQSSELDYYFFVLPELQQGEITNGGAPCEVGNELWYYENGHHFKNNTVFECPRSHDREKCPMCERGFDLMKDSEDKKYKSKIAQNYLSRSMYAVNVYFPAEGEHPYATKNPENLRGRVMWYNLPKTVWQKMDQCITSDDPGDELKPKAWGIFYHPWEGCYLFNLHAHKKQEYNSYENSNFIATVEGAKPLVCVRDEKGKCVKDENGAFIADTDRIQAILDQRHILQSKFSVRSVEKITALIEQQDSKEQGQDAETITTEEKGKPAARPVAGAVRPAPRSVASVQTRQVIAEAESQQEFAAEQTEETPAETTETVEGTDTPAEPEVDAEAQLATQEVEAPVEETPPPPAPKQAAKPAAPVARPAAPAAKPAAPAAARPAVAAVMAKAPAKPAAPVAAKPAAPKPTAPAARPAAPAAVAAGGDDPELQALLGAIKAKK